MRLKNSSAQLVQAPSRLYLEAAVEFVPGAGLVGVHDGALGDPRLDE